MMAQIQWRKAWVVALVLALPSGIAFGQKYGVKPSVRSSSSYQMPTKEQVQRLSARASAAQDETDTPTVSIAVDDPAGQLAPLDATQLSKRLPTSVGDLPRVRVKGEPEEGELPVIAHYVNAEHTRMVKITLCDIDGGVPGFSEEELALARTTTLNQQTEGGYVRTREIAGYKAVERLDRLAKTGEITLIAGERVGVHVLGRGVPMSTVESAVNSLNIPALAAIKR